MASNRTVIGLAELTALGARRRWLWINVLVAAVTGGMFWLVRLDPDLLFPILLALLFVVTPLAAVSYAGPRYNIVPHGVPRLPGAPKPVADLLVELALLRSEIDRHHDVVELVARVRDWLAQLSALPPSSREWLARRQVSGAGLHAAQAHALVSSGAKGRVLLLAAIDDFAGSCNREELEIDPYRGTLRQAPERPPVRIRRRDRRARDAQRDFVRLQRRLVLAFPLMVCAAAGYTSWIARWCDEHLHNYLDAAELGVVLVACVPAWTWLYSWIAQLAAQRYLARHVGSTQASPARAQRRARLEALASASVAALVFVVSLGAPALALLALPSAESSLLGFHVHELNFTLLITPTLVVGVATLLWFLRDRGRRAISRDRAGALEGFAVAHGHELPLGLLDALGARGELFDTSLADLPDLLRGIADGLAELDRLPAPLRVELDRSGFDPRGLAAPLRRSLARGVSTRAELHELDLALRELEPLLRAAIARDVRSR